VSIREIAARKGLKMVDSKANLVIHLHKKDCDIGEPNSPSRCAFALAATRELRAVKAYFYLTVAWLEYPDKLVRFSLPTSVQKEIVSNDRGAKARPGVFQLSKPTIGRTMDARRKADAYRADKNHRTHGKSPRKRNSVYHRTVDVRTVANTK
jgi:hypothetical protein